MPPKSTQPSDNSQLATDVSQPNTHSCTRAVSQVSETPIIKEPVENPFLKNAQGFTPFADSILAIGTS